MLPLKDYTAEDWSRLRPLTLTYRTALRTRQMRRYRRRLPTDRPAFLATRAGLRGQALAITVAFNHLWTIRWQHRFVQRNLLGMAYVVADNSNDEAQAAGIAAFCADHGVPYIRLPPNPGRGASRSHTLALNWIYAQIVGPLQAPVFAFLDHDLFPTAPVSPVDDLGDQPFYGYAKDRPAGWYLWAGYCVFRTAAVARFDLDFSQCWYRDLHSGGANFGRLYRHFDRNALRFARIDRREALLADGRSAGTVEWIDGWLHTINASDHGATKTHRQPLVERFLAELYGDPAPQAASAGR